MRPLRASRRVARLTGLALAFAVSGCPRAATVGSVRSAPNLTCDSAAIETTRCTQGLERSQDRCAYAEMIAGVCARAARSSVPSRPAALTSAASTATSPALAGSGYTPRSITVFYRDHPGGPEKTSTGSPTADPWALSCRAKQGAELAACLRSRYLVTDPAVCAEYARAFGVTSCGTPGGGWTRGPSNERWGSARQALDYFCENDPAVIGSSGRSGGWDCESTAVEWARLGAFGGEAIVTEWQRRTEVPVCGNHRRDPGETCANCPADVGACVPPPSDPDAIDCSGLALPSPGAPLFVTYRADLASTGRSEVRQLNCRMRP